MPSQKRERQRAGRDMRREAARAAQRRAQRRRQVIALVGLVALIFVIAFFISRSGDDDGTDVATDGTTTTSPADGEQEPATFGTTPCPPAEGASERTASFEAAPENCLEEGADYAATVETDVGTFVIDLAEEKAPVTVNNFVFLARHRAYEEVPFHRVIPGFVVQGGDVEMANGSGGPGYEFGDELPAAGEYKLGSVAMANSGPSTNGSQFFVITGDQGASLPPSYSLFGEVTSGFEEVVKKIEAEGSAGGEPAVTHKIVKVTITKKG